MGDLPVDVSNHKLYDIQNVPIEIDTENAALSSPAISYNGSESCMTERTRKPPTITPRRFTRFFTPRSLSTGRLPQSSSGRQLRDITKNGVNKTLFIESPLSTRQDDDERDGTHTRPRKRRCQSVELSSSPPQSSPIKAGYNLDRNNDNLEPTILAQTNLAKHDVNDCFIGTELHLPSRVRRIRQNGNVNRILRRSFADRSDRNQSGARTDHCTNWQDVCNGYVSTPSDCHAFSGYNLPFCVTRCNTNSLVAIGQEEGGIRLVDSGASSEFAATHIQFRPHRNAIMDLSFSPNDLMLASASGDQTARVIDMPSQRTISVLSGHTSSVKQIRWQPNSENVLTTSSRDGSVMVWDMRCAERAPVGSLRTRSEGVGSSDEFIESPVRYATGSLKVGLAHRSLSSTITKSGKILNSEDACVSITAFQHLANGREHLLLTASELSASIKVWDLRTASRRQTYVPVSMIPSPPNHCQTRNYGVNSMALSSDGARFYALCRDANVYVYSTNHIMLGASTEMQVPPGRPRLTNIPQNGLGPLYALSHKELRTGSFYVKASLRPAHGNKDEMLAVGSTNGCAILFPTDERYLAKNGLANHRDSAQSPEPMTRAQIHLKQPVSRLLPRHEIGSALVRGHVREVTSLCWTYEGDLVTIGDDLKARCWRDNRESASRMRACGEGGGERWGHGWAEVPIPLYDDTDD